MSEKIDGTGNATINNIRMAQQIGHPASPASGYDVLYIISGSPHGGLYLKDPAGRQIGPFITGSTGGGSGDFATLQSAVMDYMASNNVDPIDAKLTQGDYVALIFFKGTTTTGYLDATNAIHTVTTGKKLVVLQTFTTVPVQTDQTNRKVRLRNTTDGADVLSEIYCAYTGEMAFFGDSTAKFPEVAAEKVVKLQVYNVNTTKRAVGGIVYCKEVTA